MCFQNSACLFDGGATHHWVVEANCALQQGVITLQNLYQMPISLRQFQSCLTGRALYGLKILKKAAIFQRKIFSLNAIRPVIALSVDDEVFRSEAVSRKIDWHQLKVG